MSKVRPDFLQWIRPACMGTVLEKLLVRCREDCCDVDVEEERGYDSALGYALPRVARSNTHLH